MPNNELFFRENNELGFKQTKIKDIDYFDDYLFISFNNGQKILLNEKEQKMYDLSNYDHFVKTYTINGRLCAGLTRGFTIYLVDLNTMEVLFEDKDAEHISKQDDRTLHVIKKTGKGNDGIYDIITKKYLPSPENYEFEHSLGSNLYVFCEKDSKKKFYDKKRCVINTEGNILLSDVDGWIELSDNHLIIKKKSELSIVGINQDATFNIKTFKKGEGILANPEYHDGNIVIIENGCVKIISPNLEVVSEFKIDSLEEVIDEEIVGDTLKICLPYTKDGEQTNRQMHVNLKTGKVISHIRIDGYPYWIPTTYIGYDSLEEGETTDYHFYDANSNFVATISANYYESVDSKKNCIFLIVSQNGNETKKYLLNTETSTTREIDYDDVCYHPSLPYGYGANYSSGKMDFFDENFNILIPNVDFKKYDLKLGIGGFGYFIVNDYIRISAPFTDGYGRSRYRCIILKSNGEEILDSTSHKCYAIGNFIQIIHNRESEFLNTLTGEIGPLSIVAPIDETGKIDFRKITSVNNLLSVGSNTQLSLPSANGEQPPRVKKKVK